MRFSPRIRKRFPLFRIFYSTTFTVLSIILLGLLIITPGDIIFQARKNNQIYNVFIVLGAYVVTLLLAILIYASRIYTTRSVLAGIPKSWIPIESGDVGKSVRRMIVEGLARSKLIAYFARPRDLRPELAEEQELDEASEESSRHKRRLSRYFTGHESSFPTPPDKPIWGTISHPGWASPEAPEFPNLHYETVVLELGHIIEAKAVSLAPLNDEQRGDRNSETGAVATGTNLELIELLQRPAHMGLREYLGRLATLRIINPPQIGVEFLALYEQARFSTVPLQEFEFRTLMQLFTELLQGLRIDEDILAGSAALEKEYSDDSNSIASSIRKHTRDRESTPTGRRELDRSLNSQRSFETGTSETSMGTIRTAPSYLSLERREF